MFKAVAKGNLGALITTRRVQARVITPSLLVQHPFN